MIGHPVVRSWQDRHPAVPAHVRADDPDVKELLARLDLGTAAVDLGGADNLNLLVPDSRLVVRVLRPFFGSRHVREIQILRRSLATQGLLVPLPVPRSGRTIFRCGSRWAETETYVPPDGSRWGSGDERWVGFFRNIGRLHRVLARMPRIRTREIRRSFVAPSTLARWLRLNHAAGVSSVSDLDVVDELWSLLRLLRGQWPDQRPLPHHLIHGDLNLDNILSSAGGPVYLDFLGVEYGPRVHDLAYALVETVSIYLHLKRTLDPARYPWAVVPRLIRAYEDTAETQLSHQEWAALAPYAAAVGLYYDICDWGAEPLRGISAWLLREPESVGAPTD